MAAISATGLCRPPGVARVDFPLFVRNFPLDERTGGGGGGGGICLGAAPHPRIKFVWPGRMFDKTQNKRLGSRSNFSAEVTSSTKHSN